MITYNNNEQFSLPTTLEDAEDKGVGLGGFGLYNFIHDRTTKSSFALKRTEVTSTIRKNATRTSCSLAFPCFGRRHKTQARKLWKTERAVQAQQQLPGGSEHIEVHNIVSNSSIGAPKAPWLGKKSKLFLSIGVEQPRLPLVFTPIRHYFSV